jgi:RNA polymerase sigma-70 factor (family 1)
MARTTQDRFTSDNFRRLTLSDEAKIRLFSELYKRYVPELVRYASSFGVVTETAEDIVGDIFVALWKKKSWWRIEDIPGYLFTAVRNRVRNVHRNESRKCASEAVILADVGVSPSADQEVIREEIREATRVAVQQLPRQARHVFVLAKMQGLSHAEISQRLGVALPTVAMHMSRALTKLKDSLGAFRTY